MELGGWIYVIDSTEIIRRRPVQDSVPPPSSDTQFEVWRIRGARLEQHGLSHNSNKINKLFCKMKAGFML